MTDQTDQTDTKSPAKSRAESHNESPYKYIAIGASIAVLILGFICLTDKDFNPNWRNGKTRWF